MKVHPLILPNDEWNRRSRFTLKLTGLPSGTTIVDLLDVFDATKAKLSLFQKEFEPTNQDLTPMSPLLPKKI